MGPSPIQLGSTPATAVVTIRASGFDPPIRPSADPTASAAAPSLMPLELAAVTVPSCLNAGLSFATDWGVVPALGYSSLLKTEPSGSGTGTSSSVKTQASSAFAARVWLSTANASCSSLVMPYCFATTSAVSPSEIVQSFFSFGLVKRHPTVESAISGARRFQGSPDLSITYGARVMLSTPPAMNTSPSPDLIACAALA